MIHFTQIGEALKYIDQHLGESIHLECLAKQFLFSPFYFHRLFSAVVGKSLGAYVRERRILFACQQLCRTERTVLDIGLDCGYHSAQSFSRVFKQVMKISPSEYRRIGIMPEIVAADELIMRFTNRLNGGIFVKPRLLKHGSMLIAGISGDGDKTGEVWGAFEKLLGETPLKNTKSKNSYEIRICKDGKSIVHVGHLVSGKNVESCYSVVELPATQYAAFDVYVANGYDSENNAINEWLETNEEGFSGRLWEGDGHYCVEYYDHRFHGEESGSIVEIWIPVEKISE